MRYPISEKLEIIRLVERSHLPVRRTLDNLGIAKTTFYRWYDRYLAFGEAGLEDRNSNPGRVWNRIPDAVRQKIIDLALEETQLSPRELAVRFTDTRGYFVSEASVYRLPETPSTNCNTDPRRYLHGDTMPRCSPRHVNPTIRSESSPQPNSACGSCGECREWLSQLGLFCSWISASSSFPSVTTMSQKSSLMKTPQCVPWALTSDILTVVIPYKGREVPLGAPYDCL